MVQLNLVLFTITIQKSWLKKNIQLNNILFRMISVYIDHLGKISLVATIDFICFVFSFKV